MRLLILYSGGPIKTKNKRIVAVGILVLFIFSFIATTFLFLWNPPKDEDTVPEKEYVATLTAQQLWDDLDEREGKFKSYEEGDWIKIEDDIIETASESEVFGPEADIYLDKNGVKYDNIKVIWLKSTGESSNLSIASKNPSDLNYLKKGDKIQLELQVYKITNEDKVLEFIKGNVIGHPELIYDPANVMGIF